MVKVKTILTKYLVKVNDILINDSFNSLKEARHFIKVMALTEEIDTISILRQNINETVLDIYKPTTTRILTASQLDDDL